MRSAEAIVAQLAFDRGNVSVNQRPSSPLTRIGTFLVDTWMQRKRRRVRPSTAKRYEWMVEHYIAPVVGDLPLDTVAPTTSTMLYERLVMTGVRHGDPLASRTVLRRPRDRRPRACRPLQRRLLDHNVGYSQPPRPTMEVTARAPEIWTSEQLAHFLDAHVSICGSTPHCTSPAHRHASRGDRRAAVERPRPATQRAVDHPSGQSIAGRPPGPREDPHQPTLHRPDPQPPNNLDLWRRRQRRDDLPQGATTGRSATRRPLPNPESITQFSTGCRGAADLPRIRFHDLRHTHVSLLVGAGVPIKVVCERLGHSHPAVTMDTYQTASRHGR